MPPLGSLLKRMLITLKGPCTQIVYTWDPKYLYGGYFKAKVYLFGYMDP